MGVLWDKVSLTLIFSLIVSVNSFADDGYQYVSEERSGGSKLRTIKEERLMSLPPGTIDNESMSDYRVDSCQEYDRNVENEDKLRQQNLRRCKDGTVSFVQPSSEGWWGYEGKCGQTAASNALFSLCRVAAHPQKYANHYLSDYTPGVRPGTLESGLDEMWDDNRSECPNGNWRVYDESNSKDFYDNIEKGIQVMYNMEKKTLRTRKDGTKVWRKPVIALIRTPGGQILHWVAVMDLLDRGKSSCRVVINHWDDQYEVPCYVFAKWSYGVDDSYGPVVSGYVTVQFD